MLDKKSIIAVRDISSGVINVPEWGGDVSVKSPSIKERDTLASLFRGFAKFEDGKILPFDTQEAEKAFSQYRIKSVGYSLCDEKGNRLFNDEEIETILSKKSPESIDRIFHALGTAIEKKNLPSNEDSVSV